MLLTKGTAHQPMLLDLFGNVEDNLEFEFDENTSVFRGCGAILNDKLYYFGGESVEEDLEMELQVRHLFNFGTKPIHSGIVCDFLHIVISHIKEKQTELGYLSHFNRKFFECLILIDVSSANTRKFFKMSQF